MLSILTRILHFILLKLPIFFLRLLLFFGVIGVIIGAGAGLIIYRYYSEGLPKVQEVIYKPELSSKIYDSNGKLLALLHAEVKRDTIVPLEEITEFMPYAVVAIEDSNFFHHHGISPRGVIRAALKNYAAGRKVEGASTITMQLARNAFKEIGFERKWKRKIKEAILSVKLERYYTKEEIIEMYLNQVYFGHGMYGIGAASEHYFNTIPAQLSLAQCAILAGVLKGPARYSPISNPERSRNRQLLVLKRMNTGGFITDEEYDNAKNEKIIVTKKTKLENKAPYFVEYVKQILLDRFSYDEVFYGGLQVHTSLDLEMQVKAEKAIREAKYFKNKPLDMFPKLQASLLSISPSNGYIKAMVGGRDFKTSKFNRTVQAKRQPGSAFKPFIYGTAINYGIPPNRIINDSEVEFINKWSNKLYKPQNYDKKFHGPATLIDALAHSYNVSAIKLLNYIGITRVVKLAYNLGIKSDMGLNLSLALGTSVLTPLELTRAYCSFCSQGVRIKPVSITKIYDSNNNLLFENSFEYKEVLDPAVAYVLTDMMKKVVQYGSGWRARIKGWDVAGKTGTTNEYLDAWFIGFVPDLVTCVWVGYDNNTPLGKKQSGGRVAAPIWGAYMKSVVKGKKGKKFPLPANVVITSVCQTSGLNATNYCKKKFIQAFIKGTEPTLKCNIHSSSDFFESEDPFDDGSNDPDFQFE